MLLRFDPFRELDRLTDQVEQMTAGRPAPAIPMDAVQSEHEVEVHFALPGFDPASIDLEVDRNVLTLRAERSWQPGEGRQVLANERRHGRFTRQLLLGETLDSSNVQADYRDGVLKVVIPVAETAKPRKVEITGGASGEGTRLAIDTSESSMATTN